jgi:hypothetical protein
MLLLVADARGFLGKTSALQHNRYHGMLVP